MTAEEFDKQVQERAALSREANSGKKEDPTPSTDGDDKKEEDKKEGDDENVPFHKHPRFQEMAKQNREFKARLAEIDREKVIAVKEVKEERKIDPNMPFDEAMKQIKADAVKEALEAMKAEQNSVNSQTSYFEELINDGFDYLRDSGFKVSAKDEDAIAEIALDYKIKIEQPEDLEKAYKIFDMARKTEGAGKAKEDSTTKTTRETKGDKPNINYSQTSWSDLGNKIGAKLGL